MAAALDFRCATLCVSYIVNLFLYVSVELPPAAQLLVIVQDAIFILPFLFHADTAPALGCGLG